MAEMDAFFFEHTSDAVVVLDAAWQIVQVNHAATLLYRRKADQLEGRRLFDVFPDLDQAGGRQRLEDAMHRREPTRFELFYPGLFAWHAVRSVPRGQELVLFFRDISERVRREEDEAVREAVRRIVEELPVAVTITRGARHRLELVNARARELVAGRAVEGELLENALPETRSQGFIELLDRVYATGERFEGRELPLRWNPDGCGERVGLFNLIYQPLRGTAGDITGILHLGLDVTELVARREDVARLAAEREALLQQLTEGVILTDAQGRIRFVNDAARALHGVAVLDVGPEDYSRTYSLFTEDGRPYPSGELPLARVVRDNVPVLGARWRIRRPHGGEVLVGGSATPVLAADGCRIGCVLTLRSLQDN